MPNFRKFIAIALATGAFLTTTAQAGSCVFNNKKGDLNGDGKITAVDLSMMKQYMVGQIDQRKICPRNADMNGDGKITATDYSILRNKLANK